MEWFNYQDPNMSAEDKEFYQKNQPEEYTILYGAEDDLGWVYGIMQPKGAEDYVLTINVGPINLASLSFDTVEEAKAAAEKVSVA